MPNHIFAIPYHELEERGMFNETMIYERNEYMAKDQKLDAFASSPSKQPKCSLRGEWENEDGSPGKFQLRVFRGIWAAKRLFDFWTEHKQIKWVNSDTIVTEDGMTIRSPELEEIVEYKLNNDEAGYIWPEPFLSEVTAFKHKQSVKTLSPKAEHSKVDKPTREPKQPREKKERTPRPSKNGLITIGEIAAELKIEPRIARGALRAAKTPKPDAGWAWPKAEVEKIKAIVKKGIK